MDEAPGRFAEIARTFDLAIVAQAEPETGGIDDLITQAVLFQSGHPTLVVPYIQTASFRLNRVAVLWDGGAPATRAIVGAMPFLHRAKTIDLVSIMGERDLRQELNGADMRKHLSRHGLNVEPKRLQMTNDVTADDFEVCGRDFAGFARDGRIWPYALSRTDPWWRNTRHPSMHDCTDIDVALAISPALILSTRAHSLRAVTSRRRHALPGAAQGSVAVP